MWPRTNVGAINRRRVDMDAGKAFVFSIKRNDRIIGHGSFFLCFAPSPAFRHDAQWRKSHVGTLTWQAPEESCVLGIECAKEKEQGPSVVEPGLNTSWFVHIWEEWYPGSWNHSALYIIYLQPKSFLGEKLCGINRDVGSRPRQSEWESQIFNGVVFKSVYESHLGALRSHQTLSVPVHTCPR